MQRIDVIERKVKTAKDLHSIVKTMKVLAAVSISQYEDAVESIGGYYETIEQGLQILLKNQPNILALWSPQGKQDDQKKMVVVFGSGQPMCGTFNEVLSDYIKEKWAKNHYENPEKIVSIGHRIITGLERIDWQPDHQFDVPSTIEGINETVQKLVVAIQQWYSQEGFREVYLFYNHPHANSGYSPFVQQLLPIDTDWLKNLAQRPWQSRTLPLHTMSSQSLFSALLRQLLFVSIYKAFSESLSAENNSRLAAMQVAEKKIEEKLIDLTKAYRSQRQINITEEILDIIASFEVLRDEEERGG